MIIAFLAEPSNVSKIKDIVEKDPIGRSSVYYKSSQVLGIEREGMYIIIDGSPENCDLAVQGIGDLAEKLEGEELHQVLKKFDESESSAMEGFGGIFS